MGEYDFPLAVNYDDIDITDDFMFSYVMRQPDICIELLEYLLPECKIRTVDYVTADNKVIPAAEIAADTQKTLAEAYGKKGVRLDVYLDDGKTVYNVEMQTTNQPALPKRARFYQAQIDINLLERGAEYDQLRPSFIIFICKFDPFGRGQYRYTFQNTCREEQGLVLKDEAYKLFFNTAGTKGEISDHLRELLRYMNNAKDYPADKTSNDLIRKIERAVDTARQDDEWRRIFMTYQIHERDAELRGEERGVAKGRAEGKNLQARETAQNLHAMGIDVDKIANAIGYPVDTVKHWLNIIPC